MPKTEKRKNARAAWEKAKLDEEIQDAAKRKAYEIYENIKHVLLVEAWDAMKKAEDEYNKSKIVEIKAMDALNEAEYKLKHG